MDLFYADHFVLPLPDGHRFPMAKYQLLRKRVIESGLVRPGQLKVPPPATKAELGLVHHPDYLEKVFNGSLSEREIRRIGFPWSPEMVERSQRSVGASISACRSALREGIAANLAGGTHHAYPDHGEGYCVFNDVAVATRVMQSEGLVNRVVILDCDVHQGNGTAAIFQGDHSVFTFSIHGSKNFPFHKEASDLDIPLPDGTEDEAYLEALEGGLGLALERAEAQLAIYVSGADPYSGDRLGRLGLSKAGLARRDQMVLESCHQARLPVAVTMAGGYAKVVSETVDIHFQTLQIAKEYQRNDHLQR
ncbi:MAG: histone deacetylase [Anaerolineales bacterium]|jgi:acetoin utilization deacetylase AcuC-like enzyme